MNKENNLTIIVSHSHSQLSNRKEKKKKKKKKYKAYVARDCRGRGGDAGGQITRFVLLASNSWFFYAGVLKFPQDGEINVFFVFCFFTKLFHSSS